MSLGLALGLGLAGRQSAAWSPHKLTNQPQFVFDTAVTSTITQDVSHNVSALADAWGGSKVLVGTSTAKPVYDAATTCDGRGALVFSHANSSKMIVDSGSAALGNQPFAIFSIAKYVTAPDYGTLMCLGGSQTGGPFPDNAAISCVGSADFDGYLAGANNTAGYTACIGRVPISTSSPQARLVTSDGVVTRGYADGTQVLGVDSLTWITKTGALQLGGENVTGFGQCPDSQHFYGFFQHSASGSLDYAEQKKLFAWVRREFPSLAKPRRAIVHGTSIDQGYPLAGSVAANKTHCWLTLAVALATQTWEAKNYSVVGMGAGWTGGGDSGANANGTWLYGNPSGTAAAPNIQTVGSWSSIWDISQQNLKCLYFSGTLPVNDLFYGGNAAQCFASLQIIGALVAASGGSYAVCTPTPRQETGTPVGYEAARQTLLTNIRANWQGNLGAVHIHGASNATPIAITTAEPHGLATGATVKVALCRGNTAANSAAGTTITVTGPSTFTLDGSVGNGAWTGGGVAYWGSGLGGKYLVDFAADSRLSDPTNGTYYNADKVHLTDAGQAVAASIAVVALNAEG